MYLSSFRLGTEPTHLVRLAGQAARIAVIANAIDTESPDARSSKVADECAALKELGLLPAEIDLRRYFDADSGSITLDLASFDAVWVRGGNVFVLRHALAASGADAALVELLGADRLVYAGYSAGLASSGRRWRALRRSMTRRASSMPTVPRPLGQGSASWTNRSCRMSSLQPIQKALHSTPSPTGSWLRE